MIKDKSLSNTKLNIAWVSVITIFLGAILYVPALKFFEKEIEVIYYPVPFLINVNQPAVSAEEDESEEVGGEEDIESETQTQDKLITNDLKLGDNDPEVLILQEYLNSRGFLVAEYGPGSPGQETTKFGVGTQRALIKFQESNSELLLLPFDMEKGDGVLSGATKNLINS